MPPEQRETRGFAHPVFDDGATGATVRSIDDETVPAVRSLESIVIRPIDFEVAWLPIAVFDHRALNLDGSPVLKTCIVPAGSLEFESSFAGHPLLADRAEMVCSLRAIHRSRLACVLYIDSSAVIDVLEASDGPGRSLRSLPIVAGGPLGLPPCHWRAIMRLLPRQCQSPPCAFPLSHTRSTAF